MKTQYPNKGKNEIYSTTGFKDTLASPIFYPVIVVALVLGITSILGFVQNPTKLKTMVNVIHKKVAPSNVVSDSFHKHQNMSAEHQTSKIIISSELITKFDVFSDLEGKITTKMPIDGRLERIAFNYDITSENFWANLDTSSLETIEEELKRKNKEAVTIGAPLEIDHRENFPTELNTKDDSIYALTTSSKI